MHAAGDYLHERVASRISDLAPGLRKVAEFVASHPDEVAISTSVELAKLTRTSDATVVRTAQALGYDGMRGLRRAALESFSYRRDPASVLSQRLSSLGRDNELQRVAEDSITLLQQLPERVTADSWNQAVDALQSSRRIFTYGLGSASVPASYLALMLSRIGLDASAASASGFLLADDLQRFRDTDSVVVFAPLRQFHEVEVLAEHAGRVGARVVLVSEALGLSLKDRVDVVLLTPASSISVSSEVIPTLVVAHAMVLALASRQGARSVAAMAGLNELRAAIAGRRVDVNPVVRPQSAEPPAPDA